MRDADPECLLDLGLVKDRVMRPGSLDRIIPCPAWNDFAEVAAEMAYFAGRSYQLQTPSLV